MTSDDELIARVRENRSRFSPDNAFEEALDTLARRLEERKDGLERIANSHRTFGSASADIRGQHCLNLERIARSLLHPEPQEGGS